MATDINIANNGNRLLVISTIVFIIAILSVVGTYFYINKLVKTETELSSTKTDLETSISNLKKEDAVEVYNLVKINSSLIERKEKESNIRNIVSNIKGIAEKYAIAFGEFRYTSGNVSLISAAQVDDTKSAYSKVTEFIADFRKENSEIFTLAYITDFAGQEVIKFNVNFKLK